MQSLLEVRNLYKKFGKNLILKDISLQLNKGEILGVIGPSGSGKTTLLRCINQLERTNKGKIVLNGTKDKFGIVFQDLHLWPHRTVLENIIDSLIFVKKYNKKKAIEIGRNLLRQFNLEEKENQYPENLSGGQKQRVAIARALATNPKVLLLDEITSSLDPELVYELLKYIKMLSKQGISMIIVSHDMKFIRQLANKVVFLENGLVIEEGEPARVFDNPQNKRTKRFMEKINLKE